MTGLFAPSQPAHFSWMNYGHALAVPKSSPTGNPTFGTNSNEPNHSHGKKYPSRSENFFMRKMRDDSTWNRLTPEQRETLESWLFDENLGYEKTLERVQTEFGLEATIASLGRFYRRRARERQAEELLDAQV